MVFWKKSVPKMEINFTCSNWSICRIYVRQRSDICYNMGAIDDLGVNQKRI